ncbi:MAG: cyclic pyranopterin phosphate synthase MoaA [Frankiales bacterium]|nr:cyclic pyranopterin phosphate synthase MoaA [Frankiales bacterium]
MDATDPLRDNGIGALDKLSRPLRDLRVSVTDRCNFRCPYCMPRELFGPDHAFLPRSELLSFEEIARLVRAFASLGVSKVRLTGGEPLLRRDLHVLVATIAATPGIEDLALTTNGSLLANQAQALSDAGLKRITVSLDSLDPERFRALADTKVPLETVLGGIAAASAAGLPVKLNTVLRRGVNDNGLLDLVDFARARGHTLRVIEYMDVGTTNGWVRDEVVPSAEVRERVHAVHPLEPIGDEGTAERWRFADGTGEMGFVSSVSKPFCATCTRARLTAVGELFTCLFATTGTDLRAVLRSGATDEELTAAVRGRWAIRDDRYSEQRGAGATDLPKPEMSYLGG